MHHLKSHKMLALGLLLLSAKIASATNLALSVLSPSCTSLTTAVNDIAIGEVCTEVINDYVEVTVKVFPGNATDGSPANCCLKESHICNYPMERTYDINTTEGICQLEDKYEFAMSAMFNFICDEEGSTFQLDGHATVLCDSALEGDDEEIPGDPLPDGEGGGNYPDGEFCYGAMYYTNFVCNGLCQPSSSRQDAGYPDNYRGWYDVSGCGHCFDYCRWVGNCGSGGDPSVRTITGCQKDDGTTQLSWWQCRRAGTDETYSNLWSNPFEGSFTHAKCSGEGTVPTVSPPPGTFVWVSGSRVGPVKGGLVKMTPEGDDIVDVDGLGQGKSVGVDPSDGSAWVGSLDDDEVIKVRWDGSFIRRVGGLRSGILAVDPNDGNVWVGLTNEDELVKLDADGEELFRVPGFDAPASMVVDPNDGSLWVADGGGTGGRKLVKLNRSGERLFSTNTLGFFSDAPTQVAVDHNDGGVWYANSFGTTVIKRSATGAFIREVPGIDGPNSLSVDPRDGSVWITAFDSGELVKKNADGDEMLRLAFPEKPRAVSVNPDDGTVWLALEDREMIRFTPEGRVLTRTSQSFDIRMIVTLEVTG